MTTFKSAMQTKDKTTEKGAPTHSTSGKALVDLFFRMGAMRQRPDEDVRELFMRAFGQDREGAMKALFYNRDVRQGQGERRFFRVAFREIAEKYPDVARKNLDLIPEYGRWDDVWKATFGTPVQDDAFELVEDRLSEEDALLAKWLPREGKADHEIFAALRDFLFDHPSKSYRAKMYRVLVSDLSDTVEDKMTSGDWGDIEYDEVPSIASNRYRQAFMEHDEDRYREFIERAVSDDDEDADVTVNADAIHPHEIVKPLLERHGFGRGSGDMDSDEIRMLEAQWNELPDWMEGRKGVLPVVDVSGSMNSRRRGNGPKPLYVAISLGLYCAEHNKSAFRDQVMTFSHSPSFVELDGDRLDQRARELKNINWSMNTDIARMFREMLSRAVEHDVPESAMPEQILIVSDMQFDPSWKPDETAMEAIERRYSDAGYRRPEIVFWNVDAKQDDSPVKFDEDGTALVSGFDPSIMANVLSGENITPQEIVWDVLGSDRYEPVQA